MSIMVEKIRRELYEIGKIVTPDSRQEDLTDNQIRKRGTAVAAGALIAAGSVVAVVHNRWNDVAEHRQPETNTTTTYADVSEVPDPGEQVKIQVDSLPQKGGPAQGTPEFGHDLEYPNKGGNGS